jgi:glycosyltransferase involved in cell wall biosynthesis
MSDSTPFCETFLLVSGDFVKTGGMDMGNYFFAEFLARKGCEIHIVSHNVDRTLSSLPNVTWHYAPRPYRSTIVGEPMLRMIGRRVAKRLRRTKTTTRFLVNGGNCPLPDINWVHYLHAATRPGRGANIFRRMKSEAAHWQFVRMEEMALRRARVIIVNSERTKKDIMRYYRIPESIIHTAYYGTAPAEFYCADQRERQTTRQELGLPQDKHLILFIGALGDRRKGFDTLFEAWELIGPEMADRAELVVIGSGAELPMWKVRAAKSRSGRSIRFLGFRSDVPALLRASDALIAPTRYEAFGLAVLEALCCGLPALVSRDAGVAERYPKELSDLLLSDPTNVAEVAEKLRLLIARNDYWRVTMRPVANALRAYTWEDMSQAMYQIIGRN